MWESWQPYSFGPGGSKGYMWLATMYVVFFVPFDEQNGHFTHFKFSSVHQGLQ